MINTSNTSRHTNRLEKWKKGALKRFGYFISGTGFPHEYQGVTDGDFPFYKVDDMNSSGSDGFISVATNTIDQKTVKQLGAKIAPRGTIIFPKVGAALLSNKRRVLQIPGVFDNNILGFVPTYGDVRYWYYLLLTIDLGRLCNPGPVPSVNESQVGSIPLTIPPESEQKLIAAFLDQQTAKLDQLIEKKKRLVDLLQEKRQALITHVVTKGLDPNFPMKDSGIDWLGEVPAHWIVSRLKPFIILNPSKQEISKFSLDTEVTFVPMEAVNESGIVDYSRIKIISECMAGYTYFRDGDVLLAKITPCFENGKAALVDGLNNGIGFGSTEFHVLRANSNIDSHYLAYIVQSDPFRKLGEASMIGAAGQKRVPESFILNFKQAFPPIDEQVEIANFLDREISNIDKIINKLNQQITIIQEYRQALITAAVTGQIDVREKLAVSADPTPAGKEERPCHPYIPNGRWRTPSRRTLSNMEAMRKAIRPNTTGNWRCSRRR